MLSPSAATVDVAKPLRVLVSEGSSTSAREAVTILGVAGHHVEICDPGRYCLAGFRGSSRSGQRREIAGRCWRLVAGSGRYVGRTEELTLLRREWISAVPLTMTAIALLFAPKLVDTFAKKGWGAHLLDHESIGLIEREDFG